MLTVTVCLRMLALHMQTEVASMGAQERVPRTSEHGGSYPPAVVNTAALSFYARHFKWLVTANFCLVLVVAAMFAWHVFTERREVSREYFGVDFKTGRMVRLMPLSGPYLSDQAMLARVQECIVAANTYDWVNYGRTFQKDVAGCFTDDGWNAFATEIKRVGTLDQVKQQRLVSQAVATGVPTVTKTPTVIKGVLMWEVQMPIRILFQGGMGGRSLANQNLLVTVVLQRLPEYENQHGMGIVSYVAEDRRE